MRTDNSSTITIKSAGPMDIKPAEDVVETLEENVVDNPEIDDIPKEDPPKEDSLVEDVENADGNSLEEPTDEDPEEEEDVYNPYLEAAKEWKKDGFINEDTELPDDLDAKRLKELYYSQNYEGIYQKALEVAKQETLENLELAGVNQRNLQIAQALESGVHPDFIFSGRKYKALAETSLDKLDDDAKEAKMIEVITERNKERDWTPEEISTRIEALIQDDKLEQEFSASLDFFKQKDKAFEKALADREAEQNKIITEARNKARKTWNSIVSAKEIKGEKFTDSQFSEFDTAVRIPNKIVEINGNMAKITEFDEFKNSMMNDLETQLYLFKLYKFRGQEMEVMKDQLETQVTDEVLSGLSKRTKTIKRAVKKDKQPKKQQGNITRLRFS